MRSEQGNVLFFILIAIALTGLLTIAMQSTSQTGSENIDEEALLIRTSDIRQYTAELGNAIRFIQDNGISEVDISFAHADAHADYGTAGSNDAAEVFHRDGGSASFQAPPSGINDGSAWEFYGTSHLPDVGSSKAELIAVLPNVTEAFCSLINEQIGYDTATQPADTAACLNTGASGRFDAGTKFSTSPNTVNEATFTVKPSLRGCIQCADSSRHYFYVLLAR